MTDADLRNTAVQHALAIRPGHGTGVVALLADAKKIEDYLRTGNTEPTP